MSELELYQLGHKAGVNVTIKLINDWCGFECKTIADVIQAINELKETV